MVRVAVSLFLAVIGATTIQSLLNMCVHAVLVRGFAIDSPSHLCREYPHPGMHLASRVIRLASGSQYIAISLVESRVLVVCS